MTQCIIQIKRSTVTRKIPTATFTIKLADRLREKEIKKKSTDEGGNCWHYEHILAISNVANELENVL